MCRGAVGGKTIKTAVLPGFCKKECSSSGAIVQFVAFGQKLHFLGAVIHYQFSLKVVPVWKFEGFENIL